MTIKELKKELRITDATIAQWFGYANVQSYRNSSGKPKIEAGLIAAYLLLLNSSIKNNHDLL